MKMKVEAKLISGDTDSVKIRVSIDQVSVDKKLMSEFYLSILKAMREAYTRDFYKALAIFSEEDTDDMIDFFKGGEDND